MISKEALKILEEKLGIEIIGTFTSSERKEIAYGRIYVEDMSYPFDDNNATTITVRLTKEEYEILDREFYGQEEGEQK